MQNKSSPTGQGTAPVVRFQFLTGDVNWLEYGAKWVSPKLNNGEFDYWIVMEFTNMDEACGRDNAGQPKYDVSLSAVSPHQAGEENIRRAYDSCGLTDEQRETATSLALVECLHSYGVSALLWQSSGNNAHKLLREARHQATCASGLFGFYMDGAKNRIGTTGWEAIKGDLNSALARTIASGTTEGKILAKMHGIGGANE